MRPARNVTRTLEEQLFLWQLSWASLIDGIIGVVSFGLLNSGLALLAARALGAKRMQISANRKK